MVSQYNDFMLEIPACNAGAYREYLVCHETLQERPRLRLPVCGETAVLSVLFHPGSFVRSFHPVHPLSLSLSLPPSYSSFLYFYPSLSFSFFPFLDLHLSITTSWENAGGNKPLKNPIIGPRNLRLGIYFVSI